MIKVTRLRAIGLSDDETIIVFSSAPRAGHQRADPGVRFSGKPENIWSLEDFPILDSNRTSATH